MLQRLIGVRSVALIPHAGLTPGSRYRAGQATGSFGKWGLALCDQPGIPNDKGFDFFFGYLNQRKAHSYYPPYLWRNTEKVPLPENEGYGYTRLNRYESAGKVIPNGVKDPVKARYSGNIINIADVSPLASLTNIAYLNLGYNSITTGVASLVTLTNATAIHFHGNFGIPASDLDTLEAALGAGIISRP